MRFLWDTAYRFVRDLQSWFLRNHEWLPCPLPTTQAEKYGFRQNPNNTHLNNYIIPDKAYSLDMIDLRQFYSLTLREQSYLLRILVKHVVVVPIFYVQKSIHWSKMGRKGSGELSAGSLGPFEYSIPSLKWARKIMLFPFFPLSLQRFKSDTSNKASSAYNSVLIHHLQQLIL